MIIERAAKREHASAPIIEPWDRRVDRRTAAAIFLLAWVVYLATASYTTLQNDDSRAAAHAAWSLGTRGTVELPTEWDETNVSWAVVIAAEEGQADRLFVNRFPGPIIWAAPFYAAWSPFDGPDPTHPDEMSYGPAGIAAATAAALAIVVSFVTFRRIAPRPHAVGAALVLAFATSVWSISGNALWTHGLTHLGLASGVLLTASRRSAAGGLAFAVSILSRPQTAVVAAVVGLHRGLRDRSVRPVLAVAGGSAIGVVALVAYSYVNFGTWLPVSGYAPSTVHGVTGTAANTTVIRWGELFVHPQRGLLIHAAFVFLLVPGLWVACRKAEPWVKAAAVSGVVYMALQLRVNGADGGFFFFSYRLPIEMLVLASPLLLLAWRAVIEGRRARELAFAVAVAVAVGLQLIGVTTHSVERYAELRRMEAVETLAPSGPAVTAGLRPSARTPAGR